MPKTVNLGFRTYSNTFWIICGTFKKSTQYGALHLLFYVEILQRIQENMGAYSINIFHISTSQQFKVSKSLETIGHQKLKTIFCVFVQILVSPKQSASPKAFKKNGILRWWNLDDFWKSGNVKT